MDEATQLAILDKVKSEIVFQLNSSGHFLSLLSEKNPDVTQKEIVMKTDNIVHNNTWSKFNQNGDLHLVFRIYSVYHKNNHNPIKLPHSLMGIIDGIKTEVKYITDAPEISISSFVAINNLDYPIQK